MTAWYLSYLQASAEKYFFSLRDSGCLSLTSWFTRRFISVVHLMQHRKIWMDKLCAWFTSPCCYGTSRHRLHVSDFTAFSLFCSLYDPSSRFIVAATCLSNAHSTFCAGIAFNTRKRMGIYSILRFHSLPLTKLPTHLRPPSYMGESDVLYSSFSVRIPVNTRTCILIEKGAKLKSPSWVRLPDRDCRWQHVF